MLPITDIEQQVRKLLPETFAVYAYTHGRDLDRDPQEIVPEEDIPIEVPVIVIRRAGVVH